VLQELCELGKRPVVGSNESKFRVDEIVSEAETVRWERYDEINDK
jgi:hypothetical protein